jgi:hypothetical protein
MKTFFLHIIGLVSGCMLLFGGATAAQALSLEFKSVGTLSSPSAEVWLMDRGPVGIGGFDITVGYDPLLLSFNSVIFDSYLGDPTTDAIAIDTPNSGTVNAYEVSFLSPSVLLQLQPDDFVLFTLNFNAIGTGTSPLTFDSVLLSDESGNQIVPTQLRSGSVDANFNSVPEPGTILLLGAGLLGLTALRRKFHI